MTITEAPPDAPPQPAGGQLIYAAMCRVMADVAPVGKDGENLQQRYKFRAIEAVMDATKAALTRHGVFYMPTVLSRVPETRATNAGGRVNVMNLEIRYTFYAADGSHVVAVVWGEASDSADKATNKAMSAALKYALVQAFNISGGNLADGDQETVEAAPDYRSAGSAFENAAPAPARDRPARPPAVALPPLDDGDPWKDTIADISNRDDGARVRAEVRQLTEDSKITPARSAQLNAAITARGLNLQHQQRSAAAPAAAETAAPPPRIRPEDQGAKQPQKTSGGDDETWVNDFAERLLAAAADDLAAMQREVSRAISQRTITAVTGSTLSRAVVEKRRQVTEGVPA